MIKELNIKIYVNSCLRKYYNYINLIHNQTGQERYMSEIMFTVFMHAQLATVKIIFLCVSQDLNFTLVIAV